MYLTSRPFHKGMAATASITTAIKLNQPDARPNVHLVVMDHLSLKSVVAATKRIQSKCSTLHGIVNSAGIMATPYQLSEDGYKAQWQTNYLAH